MAPLDAAFGATAPVAKPFRHDTVRHALLEREAEAWDALREVDRFPVRRPCDGVALANGNALEWLDRVPEDSISGIVTDPPYGLIEYEDKDHSKLRGGRGGVWRIPPAIGGAERSPVPRFTVLTDADRKRLEGFFQSLAERALKALAPGGHVMIASNPLLSTTTFACFERAGFEKRGEIIRLVQTLRGGDRPKGAEGEFCDVTVMPRSCWEPWGLFRKPISEKTVAANLRRWGTGALRRVSPTEPFRDVIESAPTRASEREIADHPSLKPQKFMRQVVRAVLPLGIGVVYDPFVGGGSTLAAAARVGYKAIGTELDPDYAVLACRAIPRLRSIHPED
ncbi:DNA-methyltransferase [Azospirillum thermophilum]|uniref:Methyltransferase n=1 Tax=Azospirillum thermophilum TaxID=2202148 RepID=A0A2S2CNF1_9PROT|nr:DNA methyltransferase [Azospirillum thermophilum]AWK85965.1 DNA methylase [Azospirillum thermophilum]